jgi:hypothetical protein
MQLEKNEALDGHSPKVLRQKYDDAKVSCDTQHIGLSSNTLGFTLF